MVTLPLVSWWLEDPEFNSGLVHYLSCLYMLQLLDRIATCYKYFPSTHIWPTVCNTVKYPFLRTETKTRKVFMASGKFCQLPALSCNAYQECFIASSAACYSSSSMRNAIVIIITSSSIYYKFYWPCYYTSHLYWGQDYHTSKFSWEKWVDELANFGQRRNECPCFFGLLELSKFHQNHSCSSFCS